MDMFIKLLQNRQFGLKNTESISTVDIMILLLILH